MKLSTKVRYGTRAMLELACSYGKGPVLLRDISSRQEISLKYLDRILSSLKAAGLVKTLRGAKGGYALSRLPAEVTLKHIVEALEGRVELVACVNNQQICPRVQSCVTHDLWQEMESSIEGFLARTTLEDLVDRDRDKRKLSPKMYYI